MLLLFSRKFSSSRGDSRVCQSLYFLLLFSLVAGCPSLKNGGNWGGTNLLGTYISHHWFSVYRAPVLFLEGKVLGKPLPSAHHTSVSLQRRSPGLGMMKLFRETDYSCPFGHLQRASQLQKFGELRSVLHSCYPAILGIFNLVGIFSCWFFYCFKFIRLSGSTLEELKFSCSSVWSSNNCIPRLCPPEQSGDSSAVLSPGESCATSCPLPCSFLGLQAVVSKLLGTTSGNTPAL